ncbi:MAG: hypothetical protein P4L81_05690 [Candidatus Pacebacteria bacterium]|nr:hypothetical protein [Candidatus Paceibacterota bacterium]
MRNTPLLFCLIAGGLLIGAGSVKAGEITPQAAPSRVVASDDVQWVSIAVSRVGGRIFRSDAKGYENDAKAAAISKCERTTGVSCGNAISVPSDWDISVMKCDDDYFLGGSGQGVSDDVALNKASNAGYESYQCRKVASY